MKFQTPLEHLGGVGIQHGLSPGFGGSRNGVSPKRRLRVSMPAQASAVTGGPPVLKGLYPAPSTIIFKPQSLGSGHSNPST